MTILIHPRIFAMTEQPSWSTQKSFSSGAIHMEQNKHTKKMQDKPALLVVTDVADNILLSIVGSTQWFNGFAELGDIDTLANTTLRIDSGRTMTTGNSFKLDQSLPVTPRIPALEFVTASAYNEKIRKSGVAAKAYLVVDYLEIYSKDDISLWPTIHWDSATPFDALGLGVDLPYLQVSVGDMASDQALRLTRTDLDLSQHTVQMADASLKIYFKNMFRDWSGAKAEMDAVLAAIPGVGTSFEDIEAKELTAFPVA
jgi:hypothetical protein